MSLVFLASAQLSHNTEYTKVAEDTFNTHFLAIRADF